MAGRTLALPFARRLPRGRNPPVQIMFAYGDTLALRNGRIVRLIAGAPVEAGDQVHTRRRELPPDPLHRLERHLAGARRTDFVVEEYAYEPRRGGRERAFFALLNGGLRSLTGLIGHRDRSNYRLRSRTMAIGVRGTHYSVLICRQDCKNSDGSLGEDGVYAA